MAVRSADAYRQQLAALLPVGLPWQRDPDTLLQRLLLAWGDELARVDARAAVLLDEAIPSATAELLADWERACGLPGPCLPLGGTVALRRAALVMRIIADGGQTPAFYIALAAALGFTITITEYAPTRLDARLDVPLRGEDAAHCWAVHCNAVGSVGYFGVSDRLDVPLSYWPVATVLECMLRKLAPAHTTLIFTYT